MQFDEKKFLFYLIVFGIIFFVFGGMLKAQATSDNCDYIQRIMFSRVTFCDYRMNSDSTEMYDFYRLSRGSPLDTVKVVYYTKTETGCSIFRAYTTHECIDNFIQFNKEKYPVIGSNLQATSDIDVQACFKMEKEVKKKLLKIKKI